MSYNPFRTSRPYNHFTLFFLAITVLAGLLVNIDAKPLLADPNQALTVHGKVSNGTAGFSVPTSTGLALRMFDVSQKTPREVQQFISQTAADGSFVFAPVPREIGFYYVVTTQYAGVLQTSDQLMLQADSKSDLDLSFVVYEATSDANVIEITGQELYFDVTDGKTASVHQIINYSNTSDRVFLQSRPNTIAVDAVDAVDSERPSFQVMLPPIVQQINLDQTIASRYIVASRPQGHIVQGIIPCYPGAQTPLQFSYSVPMPYSQPILLPLTTNYEINALDVYVTISSGLSIDDRNFTKAGQFEVQGQNYIRYLSGQSVAPGTAYTLTLITPEISQSLSLIRTLLIVFGIAVTIAAIALLKSRYQRRLSSSSVPTQPSIGF